jgi:hypothetical protein
MSPGTPPSGAAFVARGECQMADDKSIIGDGDRSRVAAGQDYELDDFAQKHGITRDQARSLIERFGNDREKLDEAAAQLSR